jgi:3-carboxy-cis,cis-muconate cycloisomerase
MNLLSKFYSDDEMKIIWDEDSTISHWLRVESELAQALASSKLISKSEADSISKVCNLATIDKSKLWDESRNVGYPIVSLVNMICAKLDDEIAGKVHWGATTQDIMDTALVLQIAEAGIRIDELLKELENVLAKLTHEHAGTVMSGRTHGQQSTPTTFGAKCAVLLEQIYENRQNFVDSIRKVSKISFFGASGTGSALYPNTFEVRANLAKKLNLELVDIPWHVNRNSVVQVGQSLSLIAATITRLAREVIDLSRSEIREIAEGQNMYKGASSTMPQKANPIESESIIGFAVNASSQASALQRAMEAGHERSSGEWQIEWRVFPDIFCDIAAALKLAISVVGNLQVFSEQMVKNCEMDFGLTLSEDFMMNIASVMGRNTAHELIYKIALDCRISKIKFEDSLRKNLPSNLQSMVDSFSFNFADHTGDAEKIARHTLAKLNYKY